MIMMHAENGIAIDVLVGAGARAAARPPRTTTAHPAVADRGGGHAPRDHAREPHRAPLYVVHMSAKQAVAQLAAARDNGRNVFGETCPQYLYLSLEEQLARAGVRGREVGLLDAAAVRGPRATRTSCGRRLRTDDLRWSSAPTTARSA